MVILITIPLVITLNLFGYRNPAFFLFLLIPCFMLIFSFLIVRLGESLGLKSKENIIRFFETELLAININKE